MPEDKYLGPCRHDKPDCRCAVQASVGMVRVNDRGLAVGRVTRTLCYMGPSDETNCYRPHFTPAKRGEL